MVGQLIRREDHPVIRRIRMIAKFLARFGFLAVLLAGAPQLRAAFRAGTELDWTFLAPALICFGLGIGVMCLFWATDAIRAARR